MDNEQNQDFTLEGPEQQLQIEQPLPEEEVIEKQNKDDETSVGFELYTLLHDLVYILGFVTILFVFAIRLVGVSGSSMYPTLNNRDFLILLSNVFYSEPERGDIVVLTVPAFETEPIVKRVIATEGQTVDIDFEAGEVYVDGVLQQEPYINEPTHRDYELGLEYPAVVPEGCIFVLGDNRNNSTDSRYAPVGMVDKRYVLGKVLFLIFPGADEATEQRDFSRIGTVAGN